MYFIYTVFQKEDVRETSPYQSEDEVLCFFLSRVSAIVKPVRISASSTNLMHPE